MASHQQSCRRWRACLAIHNLVGAREVHSCKSPKQFDGLPEEHWESFGSFISAMESTDLVVKTEALYQLSLFLIYLAPTSKSSFTCPDAFTISIHFKNKDLLLSLKDIQVLYKKLFSELTSYTGWLFRQEAGAKESESKAFFNFCSSQCDHVHLVLFVEVLRCCIRILPLLEFNTSLSLVAVETLISVLKQLCCPTNLCRGLSAGGFDDVVERYRNQLLKTPHGFNEVQAHSYFANGHEKCGTAVPWIGLVEASIKSLEEYLSSQKKTEATASHMFGENITACSSHDAKAHTDRAQVACALLEVFMDEMLLQPGLADAFLASNVDAELDSSSSNGFSCGRHIHMIMEAAAVHFILSFSGYNSIELLHGNFKTRHSDHHGSGMSLPAAVMLLDLSVIDAVCAPDMFLVHIINTLRRSLDNTSCLTPTPKLPGEMVLGLAASVLESAVNLYCRFWTTCSLPAHHNELQNGEHINSRSDKFWSLCGGDNKKTASVLELLFDEESCSKAEHQEGRSIHSRAGFSFVANATFLGNKTLESSYHAPQSACFHRRRDAASVYSSQEQDKILPTHTNCSSPSGFTYLVSNTALLVSVLQLMSMSLLHLVVEANKQNLRSREIRLPKGGTQEPPDGSHPCVSAELYIDNAKEVFKFCASKDRGKTLEDLKLDKQLQKLLYEVDEVIGHAFIFFVERFHLSFEQGAPKTLCQAYLDVLKSLITLFISIDQRRKTENLACDTHLCEVLHTPCPCDSTMKNIVEDENLEKLCSSGRQHNAEEFMSSILIMTKKYQRKRKHIMPTQKSSQRLNEVNLSAENHVSGGSSSLKLQEKGSLRRCKPAVQKNSSSNDGNSYIEEMIASEGKVDGECFDDLNDFIVCKEGRDYSTWMNSIYKKRKKKLQRTHWERLKAKRALVSLLMCKNQHNDL